MRPGLHHPIPGGPAVVWWDPSCLVLEVEEPLPLRHQQILEGGSAGGAASEANFAAWLQQREALRAGASVPSLTVKTVTALARAASSVSAGEEEARDRNESQRAQADPDVKVENTTRTEDKRPGGRLYGSLVNALLATIALDADGEEIRAAAALQQRMFDATREEIDAAIVTVRAALQHPVLRRAAAAEKAAVRRETPVLLILEDGNLVEGIVDLAFRDTAPGFSGWTVVDFKTDREFSGESARYIRQVKLYAEAVRAATGSPTRGLILVI